MACVRRRALGPEEPGPRTCALRLEQWKPLVLRAQGAGPLPSSHVRSGDRVCDARRRPCAASRVVPDRVVTKGEMCLCFYSHAGILVLV